MELTSGASVRAASLGIVASRWLPSKSRYVRKLFDRSETAVKFVALINYVQDADKRDAVFAEHRVYLRGLLDDGRLAAAGVLAGGGGAVWVYDADSLDDARSLIENDPFHEASVFDGYDLRPLDYWSAKAAVRDT